MPTGVSGNLKMIGRFSMWESLSTSLCRSKPLKDIHEHRKHFLTSSIIAHHSCSISSNKKLIVRTFSERFLLKRIYSLKLKQNRKFQRKKPATDQVGIQKNIPSFGSSISVFAPEQVESLSIQSYGGMATPPRIVGQIPCRFESCYPSGN